MHLLDGRDLMLYRMRGRVRERLVVFVGHARRERTEASVPLTSADFAIEETARWKSPAERGVLSARWTLRVPRAGLVLDVVPLLADQELVTEKSTKVTYWEGACDVRTPAGAPAGRAYVEMTGYAGTGGLGLFR